ncbi:uncharacterized protein LOC112177017 [Rosa chinensis]|uniref:uncharacterized protein LOC112177017 n=1 Tax=Rosa chinensis TaxID=74649 RepID=UPI000D08C54F|nr:uncharacterized protein LOC112177017 [Rosa chinensis]
MEVGSYRSLRPLVSGVKFVLRQRLALHRQIRSPVLVSARVLSPARVLTSTRLLRQPILTIRPGWWRSVHDVFLDVVPGGLWVVASLLCSLLGLIGAVVVRQNIGNLVLAVRRYWRLLCNIWRVVRNHWDIISQVWEYINTNWDQIYNFVSVNWGTIWQILEYVSASWDSILQSLQYISTNWYTVLQGWDYISTNFDVVEQSLDYISANREYLLAIWQCLVAIWRFLRAIWRFVRALRVGLAVCFPLIPTPPMLPLPRRFPYPYGPGLQGINNPLRGPTMIVRRSGHNCSYENVIGLAGVLSTVPPNRFFPPISPDAVLAIVTPLFLRIVYFVA